MAQPQPGVRSSVMRRALLLGLIITGLAPSSAGAAQCQKHWCHLRLRDVSGQAVRVETPIKLRRDLHATVRVYINGYEADPVDDVGMVVSYASTDTFVKVTARRRAAPLVLRAVSFAPRRRVTLLYRQTVNPL